MTNKETGNLTLATKVKVSIFRVDFLDVELWLLGEWPEKLSFKMRC